MRESDVPFVVRESRRARRPRLRISVERGLEVVLPRTVDPRVVPGLLERGRDWIRRTWARLEPFRRETVSEPFPPVTITLPALDRTWRVEVRRTDGAPRIREEEHVLFLEGSADHPPTHRQALHRWLRLQARRYLPPRLAEWGRRLGIGYERVVLRRQRTRWGSCSRRGTISLNERLLFLPPLLVDHVLIHELCHRIHMDHSRRFWALFQSHVPDALSQRRVLRDEWSRLPRWVGGG